MDRFNEFVDGLTVIQVWLIWGVFLILDKVKGSETRQEYQFGLNGTIPVLLNALKWFPHLF